MSSIVREINKVTKKKKRKTRKCLDEMRNRSLRTMRGDLSELRENPVRDKIKSSSLITTNRLTLNLFPKAVQSETITRPILEEIKQQSSHGYNCFDNNTNIRSPKNLDVQCSEQSNSTMSTNSIPLFDFNEGSHLSHSMSLNSHNLRHVLGTTPITSLYSTTSLSSQTSDENQGHELYADLMNKVSLHLKNMSSALVKEDPIDNTKISLKKLFLKSFSKEDIPSNLIDSESKSVTLASPEESIIHNPMSYIRLKQVQAFTKNNETKFLSELSSSAPSPPEQASSPYTPLGITGVCSDIAYNTPQYNYYPHKLN